MKKLFAILFSLAVLCSLAACGTSSSNDAQAPAAGSDIPVIGISQYGEHPSLDNCREGFLLGLEEAGLSEGRDFTVLYQNAGFRCV